METRLDHYRLVEAIGAGSFATVHKAVDERLDDVVAIKILAENHSLNPDIRARFIGEARNLRKVGGGHVVSVYDIGESELNQPYLVLELADRGNLRGRVDQLRRSGWAANSDDLLEFARALAAAVGAVHAVGLVHRDLSPGNLLLASRSVAEGSTSPLVRGDERLLIADLGMCKDLAMNSGLTVAGGTDGFRPPEQEALGVVDIRADVWAMSALLQWVAQGSPFSSELSRVIRKGLAEKPSHRQRDAAAWLQEVETALQPKESGETEASAASSEQAPVAPKRGRRKLRLIAAAITLALVLAVGVVSGRAMFGGSEAPPSQAGGDSVSIEGPHEIRVGKPAVFTAEVHGVTSWGWTLPNHRQVADEDRVSVTATSAGTGVVILRAQTSDGKDLEVRHKVRVTE